MHATQQDLKTYRAWLREGRAPRKGESARSYLVNDSRTAGRALFARDQTDQTGSRPDTDEIEGWSIVISAEEWELTKAEAKEISRGPRVKVRRLEPSGTAIWCGPDKDLIELLKHAGYTYHAASRYWQHPNKDAETTARALEHGKVRGKNVRVARDFGAPAFDVVI